MKNPVINEAGVPKTTFAQKKNLLMIVIYVSFIIIPKMRHIKLVTWTIDL